MTTQQITFLQENYHQEDILPQEDQRPKTHFQLHTIRKANKPSFARLHQDRYSATVTVNPFQLLQVHNQLAIVEGHLSQMIDMVLEIVDQLREMTH